MNNDSSCATLLIIVGFLLSGAGGYFIGMGTGKNSACCTSCYDKGRSEVVTEIFKNIDSGNNTATIETPSRMITLVEVVDPNSKE